MRSTLSSLRKRGYTIKREDADNYTAEASDGEFIYTLYSLHLTTANGEILFESVE